MKKLLHITDYATEFIDKVRKKTNESANLTFKELIETEIMWIKNYKKNPSRQTRCKEKLSNSEVN